jgi:hypothetical protein
MNVYVNAQPTPTLQIAQIVIFVQQYAQLVLQVHNAIIALLDIIYLMDNVLMFVLINMYVWTELAKIVE